MNLLLTFIIANLLNVSLSTAKTLITVKCGKGVSAIISALYYAFYTYVIVLTMCELSMYEKMAVVGVCNLIGVYFVKWLEEKMRKDKLWKVEATVLSCYTYDIDKELSKVPHSYIRLSDKHTVFNFYCNTQDESIKVKRIIDKYNAKYFVAESKIL